MADKITQQPVHVDIFGKGYDPFGQNTLQFYGSEENKQVQISYAASVPAQFVSSGTSSARISVVDGFYQSKDYVHGLNGWKWFPDGTLEANNGYFRGDITAASGVIGGFTIADNSLYGGKIESTADVGTPGIQGTVMDRNGFRAYSATLGPTVNIPSDGTPPVFTAGIIQNTIMQTNSFYGGNIWGTTITGGLLRTSDSGRRIEIDNKGITLQTGEVVGTYGTFEYGDGTKYGSGALAYINNIDKVVPFYISAEQTSGDFHFYNRSVTPTGAAEVGDVAVVNGSLYVCTAAGTPGTWVQQGNTSVGTVTDFAGSSAPTGWLICNGATVSKTTYAALFAVTGHAYGADPGSGNFILPDCRGKATVGYLAADSNFGSLGNVAAGAKTVTLGATEIPSHTHNATTGGTSVNHTHGFSGTSSGQSQTHTHNVENLPSAVNGTTDGENGGSQAQTRTSTGASNDHTHTYSGNTGTVSLDHTHNLTTNGGTGGGQAHNNIQPSIVFNKIIKY